MKYSLVEFLKFKKNFKHQTRVQIVSGSMAPFIKKGESITIEPATIEEIKPWDIIIYWSPEKEIFICHMFVRREEGHIICKPLGFNKEDTPVPEQYILGHVITPSFSAFQRLLLKLFYR